MEHNYSPALYSGKETIHIETFLGCTSGPYGKYVFPMALPSPAYFPLKALSYTGLVLVAQAWFVASGAVEPTILWRALVSA